MHHPHHLVRPVCMLSSNACNVNKRRLLGERCTNGELQPHALRVCLTPRHHLRLPLDLVLQLGVLVWQALHDGVGVELTTVLVVLVLVLVQVLPTAVHLKVKWEQCLRRHLMFVIVWME